MIVEGGRSVNRISKDLGINENPLYKLKRAYLEDQQNAFPGKGKMKPEEEELKNLTKELMIVKMEWDI